MRRLNVLTLSAVGLGLLSCGPQGAEKSATDFSASQTPQPTRALDDRDAQGRHILFLQVKPSGDPAKPHLSGLTNLPNGTSLTLTVLSPQANFRGEDQVTVVNQRFKSIAFSSEGKPLEPGAYIVEVSAPLSKFQPNKVKKVVGPQYENFVGPQFRLLMGRWIETKTQFKVPSTEGKASADPQIPRAKETMTRRANINRDPTLEQTNRDHKPHHH